MASDTAGKGSRVLPALGVVLVAGLTLASGVIQGHMSRRWGTSPNLVEAGTTLANVPAEFTVWRLRSSHRLDPDVEAVLECSGYVVREYQNEATGQSVTVAVLLGPSGPISVHEPEICYSGVNYTALERPRRLSVAATQGKEWQFWRQEFRHNSLGGGRLSVYYAWNAGDGWSASENPRFEFADRPYLYKIQLATEASAEGEANDAGPSFLQDFLPLVENCLRKPSPR